jgi:hypothetical protein
MDHVHVAHWEVATVLLLLLLLEVDGGSDRQRA